MLQDFFEETYDLVNVAGNTYLFTNLRIDRKTVPDGLYAYDVADGDGDGCFVRVQKFVMVNHWGTIIGKDPVPQAESGTYYPEYGTEEYEGLYGGVGITAQEYLDGDYEPVEPADAVPDPSVSLQPGKRYCLVFGGITRPGSKLADAIVTACRETGAVCEKISAKGKDALSVYVRTENVLRTMELQDAVVCAMDENGQHLAYAESTPEQESL